jgi:hypothetical protein
MIFFGEKTLRNAAGEFLAHYHSERKHQGLGNELIEPDATLDETTVRLSAASGSAECFATIIVKWLR